MRLQGWGSAAAAAIGASLLLAPPAGATDRFVDAVMGVNDMSATCTAAPPADGCDFEHALETVAGVNDNVFLAPGTYTETDEVFVPMADVDVIGPGSQQATLNSSAPLALGLDGTGTTVSGLRIQHNTGATSGLALSGAGSLAQRVSVSTTSGSAACRVVSSPFPMATIRDSVCQNTFDGAAGAIVVDPNGSPTVLLRNVTAYATGTSSNAIQATVQAGEDVVVNARNSIFMATSAAFDVFATSGTATDTITVDLDFSYFADTSEDDANPDTLVTAPGTLGNIATPPLFVSASGNFNQAAGSPTIDRGSAVVSSLGPLDIDGQARILGAAPDIGADESVPAAVPSPPAQLAPPPTVTPKKKRCKKRRKPAGASKKRRCKRRKK